MQEIQIDTVAKIDSLDRFGEGTLMRIPDFFIIGAPKCGTTALSEYLRAHPSIFISSPKEPNFLADDLPANRPYYIRTMDDYLGLFARATPEHLAAGEASVWYLRSETAVRNIYQLNPEAKLIVMLRNPVDMIYSYHAQMLRIFEETEEDFRKAWQLQEARKRGEFIPQRCRDPVILQYGDMARYSTQVQRTLRIIPREQVKIILFDDLMSDTESVYEDALKFLRVPSDGRTEFPKVNANSVIPIPWLQRFLSHPPHLLIEMLDGFRQVSGINLGGITRPIRKLNTKEQKRPQLDPEFRRELVEFFREDVKQLSHLIDRDLSSWID